jgi:xanthine dehydrogenase large subunit
MPGAAEADAPAGVAGRSPTHESARAHVTGHARFIDDLPVPLGTLHAAPVLSPIAHGRLLGIDTAAALAMPGVVAVLTVSDIPGDRHFATPAHDEPILADGEVLHVGQVVALVVADSHRRAREAATRVRCEIEPLPAILTIEQALQAQSQVLPTVRFRRGDADAAIAASLHRLEGAFEVGGQEHFYLEGQIALALPQENHGWTVHSSTQHPGEAQHWIAHALDLPLHAVQVVCRRMGGGFGGKETQAGHLAVWATLAALRTGRPVKMRLDRDDDFMITGKRHNFLYRYVVGFDETGTLAGLRLMMASQCGFSADLSGPVNDRAIFHVDNTYFLAHLDVESIRCRTHTQSSTAFRGFGGPQGMFAIETILGDIARHLGLDALDVRERNLYGPAPRDTTHYGMRVEDNIAPQLIATLAASSRYRERRAAVAAWNAANPLLKRGLALTPVKFGISFTATHFNQAGALVAVYTDGSVRVNHGGTEMGQGLHTKVCQIVADELGVPLAQVRISETDTAQVPNASATAASSGTDLNGRAAQVAAATIRERLAALVAEQQGIAPEAVCFAGGQVRTPAGSRAFVEVVRAAYLARVQLWSDGFHRTPRIHYDKATLSGQPFHYFAYGAACTEVALDVLTGESRVLAADILHDVGRSINPAIDIGQIEGGFVQGMGWLTTEELVWDARGRLATHAPSTYKIPTSGDVPARLRVDLWPEANREENVLGSKAVGEPPFMLALSVHEALRDAVAAHTGGVPRVDAPCTPGSLLRALGGVADER